MSASLDSTVQEAARGVMQQYNVPGLAIAVSVEGKQQFFTFGVASKLTATPVTADTLFEVGSISKTLTATTSHTGSANGYGTTVLTASAWIPPSMWKWQDGSS